jgi:hypothetical protein
MTFGALPGLNDQDLGPSTTQPTKGSAAE